MSECPIKVELPGNHLYLDDCYLTTFTLNDARSMYSIAKTSDRKELFRVIDSRMSLPVESLTTYDLWYAMHWQRINSYPLHPHVLPWDCPLCDARNSDELTSSALVITDINPEYTHKLSLDFPSIGHHPFRLQVIGDELYVDNYIKSVLQVKEVDRSVYDQLLIAKQLQTDGMSFDEALKISESLTADDAFLISEFESYFSYGVADYSVFNCQNCKEDSHVKYKFNLVTFLPKIHTGLDLRSRIVFGQAPQPTNTDSRGDGSSQSDVPPANGGTKIEAPKRKEGRNESKSEKVKVIDEVVGNR